MKPSFGQLTAIGAQTLGARLLGLRFPLTLYMALTDRCPLRCIYCAVPQREKHELPTGTVLKVIHDAARMGMQRLQLVGGEPLCAPDLAAVIAAAKKENVFVTLTTGGTLIEERLDALREIDLCFVSLDGNEEAHDFHRGAGSFKKVMRGMQALRDNAIPYWTTTVMTKKNLGDLNFIIDLAARLGHLANFQSLYTTGHSYERHFHPAALPELMLGHEQARDICRRLLGLKRRGAPIGSSAQYLSYLVNWPDTQAPYSAACVNGLACSAGRLYCYLDTDGALFPCGDAIGRMAGQSVNGPGGFKAAFNNLAPPPCRSCIIACNVEQSLLFSLRIATIGNWLDSLSSKQAKP
ncbi:MAG: radical SAM protein [Chitinivibrionales bacterium]|nr:radical SAM protein [Chitinivibrionales bacterium]